MVLSVARLGLRTFAANLERQAAVLAAPAPAPASHNIQNQLNCVQQARYSGAWCGGAAAAAALRRRYGKQHGRAERGRAAAAHSDSDSDTDSDTECKGIDRSEFWRRKMRTVHNILDVDKDGLVSYNDFLLFADRFTSLGHLDQQQAADFTQIIRRTWEEQWGAVDPYNFVSVERYLEDMHHVLNDRALKKKAHRWLPYLFKAVDKDKSGFISVKEFKLFFECLGRGPDHAAVAFAVIDTNSDGKLSLKEFVKLGKDFFFTEDETRVSKMFWGPLID